MLSQSKKLGKGTLLKIFILDEQGVYSGEYSVDPECVVEYGDLIAAIAGSGLADKQTVYVGEHRATALRGSGMSLIAISKGPLGPEEVSWAKATLMAVEAYMASESQKIAQSAAEKSGAQQHDGDIKRLEEQLREREKALAEAEERAQKAIGENRLAIEAERQASRSRLAEVESQSQDERKRYEAELEKLRNEIAKSAMAPAVVNVEAALQEERKQLYVELNQLQKKISELLGLEEKLREKETQTSSDADKLAEANREISGLRAELEVAKARIPSYDVEAARRDIEKRVKILQQKAFDLLDREEKLRKREEELERLAAV